MLHNRTFAAQHPLCPRSSPLEMTRADEPFHGTHSVRLWSRCAETIRERAWQLVHAVRNVFPQVGQDPALSKRLPETQRIRTAVGAVVLQTPAKQH